VAGVAVPVLVSEIDPNALDGPGVHPDLQDLDARLVASHVPGRGVGERRRDGHGSELERDLVPDDRAADGGDRLERDETRGREVAGGLELQAEVAGRDRGPGQVVDEEEVARLASRNHQRARRRRRREREDHGPVVCDRGRGDRRIGGRREPVAV
jgi:hypothetical protein